MIKKIILAGILVMGLTAFLGLPVLLTGAEDSSTPEAVQEGEEWTAQDQEAAKKWSAEIVPFVKDVQDEDPLRRRLRLREQGIGLDDMDRVYFLMDSPIIREVKDYYLPVRFMHGKHASLVKDCAVCHHYRPLEPGAEETVRCSACHQESFNPEAPERPGLTAAYHLQCMGCHEDMNKGPLGCQGCHLKNVPDHSALVELKADPEPWEVTAECLRCHEEAGKDMLTSAHWLWKGSSTYTVDEQTNIDLGKATLVTNNF